MTDSKRAVLLELWHGPANAYDLAEGTGWPPFTVRADLKDLKRSGLVLEHLSTERHEWELSNRGCDLVPSLRQLRLVT